MGMAACRSLINVLRDAKRSVLTSSTPQCLFAAYHDRQRRTNAADLFAKGVACPQACSTTGFCLAEHRALFGFNPDANGKRCHHTGMPTYLFSYAFAC